MWGQIEDVIDDMSKLIMCQSHHSKPSTKLDLRHDLLWFC